MTSAGATLAEVSPYLTGFFGLFGVLIGGLIAGGVSLLVARQAREAAEASWMRDTRRQVYSDFLAKGQALHSEIIEAAASDNQIGPDDPVAAPYSHFVEAYAVVQTVADRAVVDAARVYTYRLQELEAIRSAAVSLGHAHLDDVSGLVRKARHDVVDAMRASLNLPGSARPADGFNPFDHTDLAGAYAGLYLQAQRTSSLDASPESDMA
jgi:hypothetical protein